jgi:hypothetical protein
MSITIYTYIYSYEQRNNISGVSLLTETLSYSFSSILSSNATRFRSIFYYRHQNTTHNVHTMPVMMIKKTRKREQIDEGRKDFDNRSNNQQKPNTCKADSTLCIQKHNTSFKRMCFYMHVTLLEGSK